MDQDAVPFWTEKYPKNTKMKTISAYVDLYSGPNYDIHYKYSQLQNICTICFTYGAGIPMLFPLGFLSFIILDLVERLSMAWTFKKPPIYSNELA